MKLYTALNCHSKVSLQWCISTSRYYLIHGWQISQCTIFMRGCYVYKVRSYHLASPIQLRINDMHYRELQCEKKILFCVYWKILLIARIQSLSKYCPTLLHSSARQSHNSNNSISCTNPPPVHLQASPCTPSTTPTCQCLWSSAQTELEFPFSPLSIPPRYQ